MRPVLDGIRVVDFTHWFLGPEAAAFLGDLGAEVFHVEQKGIGDQLRGLRMVRGVPTAVGGRHALFERFNRNKKGLALDARTAAGREIMHRLIKNCDVFVSNFQRDTLASLGLEYATLCKINPGLIYAVECGLGRKGPESNSPIFDIAILARSGMLTSLGDARSPEPCMQPMGTGDEMGGIMLAFGIVIAVLARERYGVGQEVQSSCLGSMINLQAFLTLSLLTGKDLPGTPREQFPIPTWNTYKCKDGRWIVLGAHRQVDWQPFCRAIDMPELEEDPKFNTWDKRTQNCVQLTKLLDCVFAEKSQQEWLEIFRKEHIVSGPVNGMLDLASDPQALANDFICDYDHPVLGKIKWVGSPWQFSETPITYGRCAPECGEHTEEILTEVCGYSWDEIERFNKDGVI